MSERQMRPESRINGAPAPKGGHAGLFTALAAMVFPAAAVIGMVHLIGVFQPAAASERLDKALKAGNYQTAAAIYRELLAAEFFEVAYHRGLLRSALRQAERAGRVGSEAAATLRQEYADYTQSDDPAIVDIGWYGLGFWASLLNDWPEALAAFERVQNRDLAYLNNSFGYIYFELRDFQRAEAAFYREIEVGGNIEGAYSNLARLYFIADDFEALEGLLHDEVAGEVMPRRIRRLTALKGGDIRLYLVESLRMEYITVCGLAAAAVALVLWFEYVRRLDVFEPEPIAALLLTLAMGMGFSLGCGPLYDAIDFGLGLRLGQGLWRDLAYCILGIGLVEETFKIIPFLLMLRFSRQVNESIDYVIYAGVAALGFAFMENLLYFQDPGLGRILGRTYSAVPLHMSLTAFAAYGLFYARYRCQGRGQWGYFALTFAAACIVHGLYDFWLLADGLDGRWRLLSLLILILGVQVFSNMIKNGLNQSEFNPDARERIEHRTRYLVYGLSAVFWLQYLLQAWRWGPDNANMGIMQAALFLYFPLLVIFGNLGVIPIRKNHWVPLLGRRKASTFTDASANLDQSSKDKKS